jgi:hypothetical protein
MYNNKSKNYQNSNQNNRGRNYGNSRRDRHLRANAYQANSNNSNYRRLFQYKANADNNLSKWIGAIQPVLECLFGYLASFIATDKYYKPKAPIASTVVRIDVNYRGGLKRAVETESAREYANQLIRLEADKPKMWGEIEKHMSVESKA